jgi:hypothetical protein
MEGISYITLLLLYVYHALYNIVTYITSDEYKNDDVMVAVCVCDDDVDDICDEMNDDIIL